MARREDDEGGNDACIFTREKQKNHTVQSALGPADSTRFGIGMVSTSCPIDLHHVPWSVLLSPTNLQSSSPSVLLSPLVYILLRPSLLDLELSQPFGNNRVPVI